MQKLSVPGTILPGTRYLFMRCHHNYYYCDSLVHHTFKAIYTPNSYLLLLSRRALVGGRNKHCGVAEINRALSLSPLQRLFYSPQRLYYIPQRLFYAFDGYYIPGTWLPSPLYLLAASASHDDRHTHHSSLNSCPLLMVMALLLL